jgi:hypothetical protein
MAGESSGVIQVKEKKRSRVPNGTKARQATMLGEGGGEEGGARAREGDWRDQRPETKDDRLETDTPESESRLRERLTSTAAANLNRVAWPTLACSSWAYISARWRAG